MSVPNGYAKCPCCHINLIWVQTQDACDECNAAAKKISPDHLATSLARPEELAEYQPIDEILEEIDIEGMMGLS